MVVGKKSPCWRWLYATLTFLVLLSLFALTYLLVVYGGGMRVGRAEAVRVTLPASGRITDLTQTLEEAALIDSPVLFSFYARIIAAGHTMRNGHALYYRNSTPRDLVARSFVGFGQVDHRIVIPEGFSLPKIAARLDRFNITRKEDFLSASRDPALLNELAIPGPSFEGFLLPATYDFREGTSARDVIRHLARALRRVDDKNLQRALSDGATISGKHFTPLEVVTLASIVEKEAAVASERPQIARVFLNRLLSEDFKPRLLQADPTISYGCAVQQPKPSSCGKNPRRITRAMLLDPTNLYNTYQHEGLPPGPIACPGLAAIRAVLSPADTDDLYFVADGSGKRHRFASTLKEHNENVSLFRKSQETNP